MEENEWRVMVLQRVELGKSVRVKGEWETLFMDRGEIEERERERNLVWKWRRRKRGG